MTTEHEHTWLRMLANGRLIYCATCNQVRDLDGPTAFEQLMQRLRA